MATWQRILVTALIGASCAYACKVTTSDDDEDDISFDDNDDEDDDDDDDRPTAGTGGRTGTAGTGGRASGGTAGTGGTGTVMAGRGGSGGSGGRTTAGSGGKDDGVPDDLSCSGEKGGEPRPLCTFDDPPARYEQCFRCLTNNCCSELKQCYAENPADACGWGGPGFNTEYTCYMECLVKAAKDSGFGAYDPDVHPMLCGEECGTPVDGKGMTCSFQFIANSTNELASCMHLDCETECIDDLVALN